MQLRVKAKRGKVTFFPVASAQEGHSLARGIFKGMQCKIVYNRSQRDINDSSDKIKGTLSHHIPELSSPYASWLRSLKPSS